MAMTGLDTLDTSVQKSEVWVKEIMGKLGWENRHRAYSALRSVLIVLRDNLTVEESADLSAQLPMVIRGLYYDRWQPSQVPARIRDKEEFLSRVADELNDPGVDSEKVVRSVFDVLKDKITQGEIDDVRGMMPHELKDLWQ